MKKKQIGTLVLAGLCTVMISACDMSGKSNSKLYQSETVPNQQRQTDTTANNFYSDQVEVSDSDENTSSEAEKILEKLGVGWSLGNTLDACESSLPLGTIKKDTETLFGNPKTTKKMIDMVRDKGFQTVRIPVTYMNHIQQDGTVDPDWLKRVKEVVDYVIDDDMNCVINMHTDVGDKGWLTADKDSVEKNKGLFTSIWNQVSDYFKSYDEKLMFEGYNEIINAEKKWDMPGQEAYDAANQLNQLFVDTVRKTGGNNAKRYLFVNTYAAGSSDDIIAHFVLPKDSVEERLIVGIHNYEPTVNLPALFSRVKKNFADQKIPVVIAECALSREKPELDREEYAAYYRENARKNGMTYFWWDDGNYSSQSSIAQDVCNYALLNRDLMTWAYPEIANKLLND